MQRSASSVHSLIAQSAHTRGAALDTKESSSTMRLGLLTSNADPPNDSIHKLSKNVPYPAFHLLHPSLPNYCNVHKKNIEALQTSDAHIMATIDWIGTM